MGGHFGPEYTVNAKTAEGRTPLCLADQMKIE
jgi:hypothetical protein